MSDKGETVKTTFRMPKELLKEVKHHGTDHDLTNQEVFVAALREYLGGRKK